jgi:serine/threonine protein kinase
MGEVWEAVDTAGGENVAIKLLRREVAGDEDLLRRFRKEGRVLAKVYPDESAAVADVELAAAP